MGRTKKDDGDSKSAEETVSAIDAGGEEKSGSDGLTPKDVRFLDKVSRLLIGLAGRKNFARASLYGYSVEQHREGWQLYRTAMGENIPLDHLVPTLPVSPDAAQNLLLKLDKFENRWFPTTRSVIRRFAPKRSKDASDNEPTPLELAFFDKLEQKPLGPAVIGSVTLFVERVAGLDTSDVPGAKKVRAVLAERGLTNDALDEVRKLLTQAATPTTTSSKEKVTAEAAAKSEAERRDEQRAALAALRKWREDWRTTLAEAFTYNTKVELGLLAVKGRKKSDDGADDEETEE
jgi:hypothetical protein